MAKDVLTGERRDTLMANFRKYPREQATHALTGFIAITAAIVGAITIHPAMIAALWLSWLVCVRQSKEFEKIRDTIGHDMFWHMLGLTVGIFVSGIVGYFYLN